MADGAPNRFGGSPYSGRITLSQVRQLAVSPGYALTTGGTNRCAWSKAGTAPIIREPLSMAGWFRAPNAGSPGEGWTDLLSIWDNTNGSSVTLATGHLADDDVRCRTNYGGQTVTSTLSGLVPGDWFHLGASLRVKDSPGDDVWLYGNGGFLASLNITASLSTTSFEGVGFGTRRHASTAFQGTDVATCWCAIWGEVLPDDAFQQLAAGAFPWEVYPQSLVGLWPLIGDRRDYIGAAHALERGAATNPQPNFRTPGPEVMTQRLAELRRRVFYLGLVAAGGLSVTGATISSGSSVAAPSATYEATAAFISSGSSVAAPSAAHVVAAAAIAPGSSVAAPTLDHQVAAAAIASGSSLGAPSAAYALTAATIASGSSVAAPADVEPVVSGATIASGSALSVPTMAYAATLAVISAGSALFAPTVGIGGSTQEVTSATVASGSSVAAPTVDYQVAAAAISSGSSPLAPTLAMAVSAATLSSGASTAAPSVAHGVDVPAIASGSSLAAPTATYEVVSAAIAAGSALAAPTVSPEQDAVGAFISSGSLAASPAVAYVVAAAAIASGSSLAAPVADYAVLSAVIASGSSLFGPLVAFDAEPRTISLSASRDTLAFSASRSTFSLEASTDSHSYEAS